MVIYEQLKFEYTFLICFNFQNRMNILHKKHEKYPETVLVRNFSGLVDVQEIIDSWKSLEENNLISNKTRGVINILTDCELNMGISGFNELMNYLKENQKLKCLKLAVVCTDPKTIVFPVLAETYETEIKIKPFSSENAAINWILNS